MTDHEEIGKQNFNLQDLREGSPQAFRIFFLTHFAEFFSFANLLLRDKASCKNVTAAAFFLVWAKHGDFDSEKNIKAFLYTTIRDNCLHYLRHLQENPDAKGYAPEMRFIGSLPEGILREMQAFAEPFGAS